MLKTLNHLTQQSSNNPELKELIKSTDYLLWFAENNEVTRISKETVEMLKTYYEKLGLNELTMLWLDNYNSMMIARYQVENHTSYIVRHKVLALGVLINKHN